MNRFFVGLVVGCWAIVSCNQKFSFDVHEPIEAGGGNTSTRDAEAYDRDAEAACTASCAKWNQVCDWDWQVCVECNDNSDCQAIGKKRCWVEDHRCVDCATDNDCIAGQQHCVSQTGECRPACTYGAGDDVCEPDGTHCSDLNVCLSCDRDIECSSTGRGKRCLPGSGYCVACVSDADCTGGQKCDTVNHTCVACKDGRDCASGCCNYAHHQCY